MDGEDQNRTHCNIYFFSFIHTPRFLKLFQSPQQTMEWHNAVCHTHTHRSSNTNNNLLGAAVWLSRPPCYLEEETDEDNFVVTCQFATCKSWESICTQMTIQSFPVSTGMIDIGKNCGYSFIR